MDSGSGSKYYSNTLDLPSSSLVIAAQVFPDLEDGLVMGIYTKREMAVEWGLMGHY